MVKKGLSFIVVLFFGYMGFYLFSSLRNCTQWDRYAAPVQENGEEEIGTKRSLETRRGLPQKIDHPLDSRPPSSSLKNSGAEKPQEPQAVQSEQPTALTMPFTVKNGKAIAMGDIFLGRTVDSTIEAGHFKPSALKIWPQSIIPFVIEEGLDEALILQAITKINAASPVRWVPRPSGAPYFVGFFKGEEPELCLSQLGFQGVKETPQPIYLGENCGVKEILHELLHTMGLVHEHSRPDRDNWIQVHWENIPEEFHSQFAKVSPLWAPKAVLQEFDYNSLMLYTPYTFSISSSLPAISSRIEGKSLHLKAPVDLSEGDLLKLNRLYKK